jgi:hypothetical protein
VLCITRAWALATQVIAAPDTPGPVRDPLVEMVASPNLQIETASALSYQSM